MQGPQGCRLSQVRPALSPARRASEELRPKLVGLRDVPKAMWSVIGAQSLKTKSEFPSPFRPLGPRISNMGQHPKRPPPWGRGGRGQLQEEAGSPPEGNSKWEVWSGWAGQGLQGGRHIAGAGDSPTPGVSDK